MKQLEVTNFSNLHLTDKSSEARFLFQPYRSETWRILLCPYSLIQNNETRYHTIEKENRLYLQHRVVSQLQRKHMAHAIQFVEETFLITVLIFFQISSGKWTVASNG